jgi:hypothetical protein
MKKILVLATMAFLVSGAAFAGGDGGKEKAKTKKTCTKTKACGKECSKHKMETKS